MEETACAFLSLPQANLTIERSSIFCKMYIRPDFGKRGAMELVEKKTIGSAFLFDWGMSKVRRRFIYDRRDYGGFERTDF